MTVTSTTPLYNINTQQYPIYLQGVRAANPNVSLPLSPTEDQLAALGYAVVAPTTQPTGDVVTEGAPQLVDGQWVQTWSVREFTTEEMGIQLMLRKQELREQINYLRDTDLSTPIAYTFPDQTTEHIQMRSDDQFNLTHLRLEAKGRVDGGDTTTLTPFRTLENTTKQLTPPQMMDMTAVPLNRVKQVYNASWTLKDQVEAAQTIAELPSVPGTLVQ